MSHGRPIGIWSAVRRLLLVRLDNAGDVVLLSPALRALREALPEARITLLASRGGAPAASLVEVDEVIEHAAIWQQLEPGRVSAVDERALIERLRAERFDAALIFTSFAQSAHAAAYACFLAGIPIRCGFADDRFGGQLLTHPIDAPDSVHQAERATHLVRALGIPVRDERLMLRLLPDAAAEADRLLKEVLPRASAAASDETFVVLAPGASASARRYSAARFARVAGEVHARTGLPVLVVGSEGERGLAQVVAGAPGVVSVAGRTTLPVVAALIARSAAVIANNSLAMHLADAFTVPVVATYSGSDPVAYWAPRTAAFRPLSRPTPCAPCFAIDCPRSLECLDIPPGVVVEAVLAMLATRTDARQAVA